MSDKGAAWELGSDLFTDYDGTVTDVAFISGDYGWQVQFRFKTDTVDEHTEWYRLPPGWESVDGGETIQHRDGKKLSKNSQYGKFVTAALGCEGAPEVLFDRGEPTSANTWVGTTWHMDQVETPYKVKDSSGETQEGVSVKNYPSRFLGVGEVTTQTGTTTDLDALFNGNQELRNQLTTIATSSPDYNTFLDQALKLPAVTTNNDLVSAVADQGGLWAALRGQ